MPAKHTRSHVFNAHKRKANKRGRGGPRIMSITPLLTRLKQVPEKKVTMVGRDVVTGQEVQARITSASITVMPLVEQAPGMVGITPEAPSDDADTSISDTSNCESSETVEVCADSDKKDEDSMHLGEPCDESVFTSCSELECTIEGDCLASDQGISKASKREVAINGHSNNPRCTRVGLPPQLVVPLPGSALRILGSPALPPALLPTYTNEIKIATTEPIDASEVPAYSRHSMSSWFRGPTSSNTYGNSIGLAPAGTAFSIANGRSDPWAAPRSRRRNHAQPHVTTRIGNADEITWQEMPKVPKEGPTPQVLKMKLHSYIRETEKDELVKEQVSKRQTSEAQEVEPQVQKHRAGKPIAVKPSVGKALSDKVSA
jgi:hypothetical protein